MIYMKKQLIEKFERYKVQLENNELLSDIGVILTKRIVDECIKITNDTCENYKTINDIGFTDEDITNVFDSTKTISKKELMKISGEYSLPVYKCPKRGGGMRKNLIIHMQKLSMPPIDVEIYECDQCNNREEREIQK